MKPNFWTCLEWLLVHEGGYVDHPKDPGGATKLGVTLGTLRSLGIDIDGDGDTDKDDVRLLDVDDVAPIYKSRYWDAVKGDHMPAGVDWVLFDWAVNSGPKRPIKALQRAAGVVQDGIIGPATLHAVWNANPLRLIDYITDERQRFYEGLSTFETFGRGWTRRNKETREQALSLLV